MCCATSCRCSSAKVKIPRNRSVGTWTLRIVVGLVSRRAPRTAYVGVGHQSSATQAWSWWQPPDDRCDDRPNRSSGSGLERSQVRQLQREPGSCLVLFQRANRAPRARVLFVKKKEKK
ncbi:hypothetical protein HPB50_016823 [Hyalomma asiaticum]|uniref:Uncharacterized protein n=1 Tax=Hyalomma asiaticum TaxID=266040 RepID=A0ACB7TIZ3_HYAAI|nr:hypothetical protein HPB50_016823 [Hyalomma asiaticum]